MIVFLGAKGGASSADAGAAEPSGPWAAPTNSSGCETTCEVGADMCGDGDGSGDGCGGGDGGCGGSDGGCRDGGSDIVAPTASDTVGTPRTAEMALAGRAVDTTPSCSARGSVMSCTIAVVAAPGASVATVISPLQLLARPATVISSGRVGSAAGAAPAACGAQGNNGGCANIAKTEFFR